MSAVCRKLTAGHKKNPVYSSATLLIYMSVWRAWWMNPDKQETEGQMEHVYGTNVHVCTVMKTMHICKTSKQKLNL